MAKVVSRNALAPPMSAKRKPAHPDRETGADRRSEPRGEPRNERAHAPPSKPTKPTKPSRMLPHMGDVADRYHGRR